MIRRRDVIDLIHAPIMRRRPDEGQMYLPERLPLVHRTLGLPSADLVALQASVGATAKESGGPLPRLRLRPPRHAGSVPGMRDGAGGKDEDEDVLSLAKRDFDFCRDMLFTRMGILLR
jgi:hypothetical protein